MVKQYWLSKFRENQERVDETLACRTPNPVMSLFSPTSSDFRLDTESEDQEEIKDHILKYRKEHATYGKKINL